MSISFDKEEEKGSAKVASSTEKAIGDAYGNLVRNLTPEELSQSGTQKLILNDLARSEDRVKELEPYQDKYYAVFTEKSVLEEKLAKTKRSEILYSFCITSGGVIIGLAKMFVEAKSNLGAFMFTIGGLLIIGGILFKITFRK